MSKLRVVLVILIIAVFGIWLYVGPLRPEPGLDLDGQTRTADITPRRFVLWELHPGDTVRVVELLTLSSIEDSPHRVSGQSLQPEDDVLALEFIGGELVRQNTVEEVYRGGSYLRTSYWLSISSKQYGYDMCIDHPPHLHQRGKGRLLSIGVDPKTYAQEILAIAVPINARLKRIYDYQPYRHITLSGWDIFYYDATDIQGHVSIHIAYRPDGDASSLDWAAVEANR